MEKSIYARKPLGYHKEIPIFSENNEYIENYIEISEDHLKALQEDGINPFIPEGLWTQLEESTINLIKKYSNDGDIILDVGVGLGRVLSHFPTLKRFGNDISVGYLEEARVKGIDVCFSLIEDMPYKNNIFDIVVCTDVLEHAIDLNLAIKKILGVLRKGGIIIVRVPYRENLEGYFDAPYKYVHLRNFDEYSLRLLIEKVFDCVHIETTFSGYFIADQYIKWQIPYLNRLLTYFLKVLRKFDARLADQYCQYFYHPVDFNLVMRK